MKPNRLNTRIPALAGVLLAFFISFFLMFHTFSYDGTGHELRIASKLWSDFGAHIPMIRSFSYGDNLTRLTSGQPVESPLFPGEPIRYHFGFYALVGLLEKLGIRIDWALNVPSAIGFFLLIVTIFLLSRRLFDDVSVALLSVVFFLWNGSLSFLRFFSAHPLSASTVADITTNSRFPSFGPWDNGLISAFWNLNIYTNQRHLGLSYGIVLLTLTMTLFPPKPIAQTVWKRALLTTFLAACLLFINYPAALILGTCLLAVFIAEQHARLPLALSGILTVPALLFLFRIAYIGSDIAWQPGYLIPVLTLQHAFVYWFHNLGLHLFLIPTGLILAPKPVRRVLLGPLLLFFILPNLYRLSPDMINNHKFFNFFLILGAMFTSCAVVCILNWCGRFPMRMMRKPAQIIMGFGLIGALTLSGIIDMFPVINDYYGSVPDIAANPDARFFAARTKPSDIILNSTWFYHPASIAGRSLFSGYTYFTWSYGYDQSTREATLKRIYAARNPRDLCEELTGAHIAYVELNASPESYIQPNWELWERFVPSYENPQSHLKVFATTSLCTE